MYKSVDRIRSSAISDRIVAGLFIRVYWGTSILFFVHVRLEMHIHVSIQQ